MSEPAEFGGHKSWSRVTVTQENYEHAVVAERVQTYQRNGGNVIAAKLRLNEDQNSQITRIMDSMKRQERDFRFEWCLVEISLYNQSGIMTDWVANGNCNASAAATVMHLIVKRMPKPHVSPVNLYHSLMKGGPPPPALGYCGPPPCAPPPSVPIVVPRQIKLDKPKHHSDTSDTETLTGSSDSSISNMRRRLRNSRTRKTREKGKRYHYVDPESTSDSEDEDEDIIKIDLKLKRGDSVVTALVNLWTAKPDITGNGRGNAL